MERFITGICFPKSISFYISLFYTISSGTPDTLINYNLRLIRFHCYCFIFIFSRLMGREEKGREGSLSKSMFSQLSWIFYIVYIYIHNWNAFFFFPPRSMFCIKFHYVLFFLPFNVPLTFFFPFFFIHIFRITCKLASFSIP